MRKIELDLIGYLHTDNKVVRDHFDKLYEMVPIDKTDKTELREHQTRYDLKQFFSPDKNNLVK